jgi:tetratricopeptide (TPR) repeat protein
MMVHGEHFEGRMKRAFNVLLLCSISSVALATEYGHYDPKTVVSLSETTPGKPAVTINVPYFVQILNDLGSHAGTWPVKFDSIDDRRRAEHDVALLSAQLDIIADNFRDESMLLRLALLHAVGHNLDIPGSSEKAVAVFDKVLERWPNDPQANYRYGVFLAGTAKNRDAIPFLEKAKSLGVVDADYTLGLTYMSLGDKDKAVANLKSYTARVPGDENATRTLDAVINGKVEIKQLKASP